MDVQPIRLTVIQPDQQPQRRSFEEPLITLGRSADCTLPIRDRYLSRHHAEIFWAHGEWLLRDCGSSNGTMLNGVRVTDELVLKPGDFIELGDCRIVFGDGNGDHQTQRKSDSQIITSEASHATNLSMPIQQAIDEGRLPASMKLLNSLVLELIEDRPTRELFDFIVAKVMELLNPSRAAIAVISDDRKQNRIMALRKRDQSDSSDLVLSRTLLQEVLEEKKVISFTDISQDERLLTAKSIIGQAIRSAVCAPLLAEDSVLGVLYLDFVGHASLISEDDILLIAQIARLAAVKLETTRLREESVAKAKMEEELRTAYTIQSRLLPKSAPTVEGYEFAGMSRPCRTVSGDYFDYTVRPDGTVYFIIADVSGKGITAALIMSSLATAFNIFAKNDSTPGDLVENLNSTLAPKTSPSKFVTLFVGRLHPDSGLLEFTNAGHVSPLILGGENGIERLSSTDMVVGLFDGASYRTQSITLEPGSSIVMFTDGVTEAENDEGEELGLGPVEAMLEEFRGARASEILPKIESFVQGFTGHQDMNDDLTMLSLSRHAR